MPSPHAPIIDPFYRRALALFELREYDKAARDLQHVIATEPKYDYGNAYCLYARTLGLTGKKEQALVAFERLLETSHAAPTLYETAAFYADNGRESEARAIVESILARGITMPAYRRRRDRVWLRKAKALRRRLQKSAAAMAAPQLGVRTSANS